MEIERLDKQPLAGKSVLVLEDEFLIAMDVEQLCHDNGARQVSIAKNLGEAGAVGYASGAIDIAILDVMLGNQPTFEFARRLVDHGVPFVFATGYTDPGIVAREFPGVEMVTKPYAATELVGALSAAIRRVKGSGG